MTQRKQAKPAEPPRPPFYLARVPLPVAAEMGSGAPRAFNPGDKVPAGHVEQFGWQEFVELPPGDWQPPSTPDPGPAGSEKE